MSKLKTFILIITALVAVSGVANVAFGFYESNYWQVTAGYWQVLSACFWTMIPEKGLYTKEVVK